MLRENKIKQLSQDEVEKTLKQSGLPNYYIQYILTGDCPEEHRSKLELLIYLMDETIPLSHRLKLLLELLEDQKCDEFLRLYFKQLNHKALDELKQLLHTTDYNNLFVELDRICLIQLVLNHRDTHAIIDKLISQYNTFIQGRHSWRYTIDELKISNSILLNPGQEQQQITINDSIKGFIKNQQKELDEVFELLKIFSDENEKVLRKDLHQQLNKAPLIKEEFKVRFPHPFDYYLTNSTLRKGDKTRIKQCVYAITAKYFPSLPVTAKELRDSEGRTSVTDADFKAFRKSKTDLWFKSKK